MSSPGHSVTKILKALQLAALMAFGAFAVGCGPAPGYESSQAEPRVPVGYSTPREARTEGEPAPLTSEELQAQNEARAAAGAPARGEIAVGTDEAEYSDTDPSALTEFKPALDGHGAWVDDSTYGTVWVPAESEVGTDFVPYTTAGHWTYDDNTSWVWVSDYSWGWAPFHYGRWVHVSHHGWAWIPGRTYAGAWVSWRSSPGYDYIGWSPLGPSWYWYNGVAVGWTFGYGHHYSYCHRDYIYSPTVVHHVVRGPQAVAHESRTQPYTPANPSVAGGGRVAASPTVGNGRTAATPSVGGGRAIASPGVGPRPSDMGIRNESIVAPPSEHAGLSRARTFASPQTAVAQGASPPITAARRRPFDNDSVATNAAPRVSDRAPATASPYTNRFEASARAPQVQGVNPVPPRQAALPEMRPTPRTMSPSIAAQPQPQFRPSPSPQVQSAPPSFRSSPSVQSPPSFRSSPSIQSTPSFRSAPSVQSSPSFRSSPSVQSSPSFRSSSPAVRSAPSVRSAPAVRAAPSVRRR